MFFVTIFFTVNLQANTLSTPVKECAEIYSDEKRLMCFDQLTKVTSTPLEPKKRSLSLTDKI